MTILGNWSAAETQDLLAAKDAEMANLDNLNATYAGQWVMTSPVEYNGWFADYKALEARYNEAKKAALAAIESAKNVPFVGLSSVPTDSEYKAVLSALSPIPNSVTVGSMGDVFQRINGFIQSIGQTAPAYSVPQPRAGTDADINLYQAADHAIKVGESAAATITNPIQKYWKVAVGGFAALLGLVGYVAIKR